MTCRMVEACLRFLLAKSMTALSWYGLLARGYNGCSLWMRPAAAVATFRCARQPAVSDEEFLRVAAAAGCGFGRASAAGRQNAWQRCDALASREGVFRKRR